MRNLEDENTRLKRLKVFAVGLVDLPAVRRKFLILKRGVPTEKALEAKHEAEDPQSPKNVVGNEMQQVETQGGEKHMKPSIKDAIVAAATDVVKKIESGEVVEIEDKPRGTGIVTEEVEEIKEVEKKEEVEEKKEEVKEEEVVTDSKLEKEETEEAEETEEKETETEKKVTKAKVKVSIETEGKEDKEEKEEKEEKVVSDVTAGAFTKVFGILDRNISAAKGDDAKRRWRAIKAMLSKTLSNLSVKKAEVFDFKAFATGLATVEAAVDALVKTQPKAKIGADSFKPVVTALDKLIGAAEGSAKTALQTIKSTLSKLVSDAYAPAPSAQEKGLEINDAEELALIAQNVEEIVTKLGKFETRMAKVEKAMDTIPVHKGLDKGETPRKQGEEEGTDLIKKHEKEDAPTMLRSVIKDLEEANQLPS